MLAHWYIINTSPNHEQSVAAYIRDIAARKKIEDLFQEIIIPLQSVTELKKGKKIISSKKIFPGYIVMKVILNDLTWNIIKNVPGVIKILGNNGKPSIVSENEVNQILQQVEDNSITKDLEILFDINEVLKITDGPFESFTGSIEEIDSEKKKLKVLVSIFGRSTPVELDFNQVEKINI